MKKETSNFKVQELRALAAQKIAAFAKSKNVITTDPEKDELTNGDPVFLFRGYNAADPNGKRFEVVMNKSGAEINREEAEKEAGRKLFLSPVTEVDPGLLFPFPAATGDITISPTENHLTLKECDTLDEVITVTIPKDSKRKLDIYFLADTTGSMFNILAAVKAGVPNIISGVPAGNDIFYGVGNYKDFNPSDPFAFQHQLNPTDPVANLAAIQAAINTWSAGGGVDAPEAQLFALDQLAEPPGGGIGWRTDSKRIIVWFGDQPGHDPSGGATLISDIAKLQAENISVIAISVGDNLLDATGQATAITSATGGSFQSGINANTIVNAIITLINGLISVINNVSLVASGGTAPFVTSITPAAGYGPLKGDTDHVLTFNVTFTGVRPCDDTDKLYFGSLDVVADGIVVAQKKVEIKVPACCKKRRYSYSVKYVIGLQDVGECNSKKAVNAGNYTTEINIHNYQKKKAVIEKHIVPVILKGEAIGREPKVADIVANDKIVLPPYTATMDDTFRLAELLYKNDPPCTIPLNIGFLHIISNIELAVTAVYTAAACIKDKEGTPSIEIKEITGKAIPVEEDITREPGTGIAGR
jgi:hypothetical protein